MANEGAVMLLFAVAIASDSFPELQACLEQGNHTQLTNNTCTARHARVTDARRTLAEQRIGWMGDQQLFANAQKQWLGFRELRCTYLTSFLEGGSAQPIP